MSSSYTIGAHFDRFVRDLVKKGRYSSASEVIRDGLRMVEDRERHLLALDAALAHGMADAAAGRVHSVEDVRAELLAELREPQRPGGGA